MANTITLDKINKGEFAYIDKLNIDGDMRRRLQDIGLTKNTKVQCLGRSPLGDPIAFFIRGAVIALRAEDCERITVSTAGGDENGTYQKLGRH